MKRIIPPLVFVCTLIAASYVVEWFIGGDRPLLNMCRHGLGGFAAGWLTISFWRISSETSYRTAPRWITIMAIVAGVALLGVSWEIFEYQFDLVIHHPAIKDPYADTISDLKMDLLGAAIFSLLFFRKKPR